ncbi:3-hydroxyacyl-ACP dehydratase FabZ family protein [Paenibacillus sp. FSL K6-0108]|uniref:3-hydroxyacyl-ACP dehydratase FabZ family protein n=1 Tax=Paenibacillus sp. FSL K6-0108 TaxID=2921417 RepID=UPI003255BE6B
MTKISNVLPHRYPFLFVDQILEIEQNKWVKGYKNITINEWFFYENNNSVPSTLIIEGLAQLGAFATMSDNNGLGFLSALKGIEVLGQAYPGDRLDLYYKVLKNKRGFIIGEGVATVGNKVIIRADEIMIYLQANTE